MYATGHYGAALLVYAPVGYVLLGVDPLLAVAGGAGVLALATLPDTDQRIPLVPHRGPTHSLVFLVAVAAVLGWLGWQIGGGIGATAGVGQVELAAFAAGVGVMGIGSHLLADVLTPAGVNLLWPLPGPEISLYVTRADDVVANWALLGMGVLATAVVWVAGAPA